MTDTQTPPGDPGAAPLGAARLPRPGNRSPLVPAEDVRLPRVRRTAGTP
ncbi:hypothetical protein [Streptomyces sp. NPDC101237]